MQTSTIEQIIEYLWLPIVTALVLLWRKFSGIDSRTQLLEQAQAFFQMQRKEERELRDAQRTESLERTNSQHKTVMTKLDSLETRIKNGK